jgi:hypothetical protein
MAKSIDEFGDFQTPRGLAGSVVALLRDAGISPSIVVEPTCGTGSLALAAMEGFRGVHQIFAYDINADHVATLKKSLRCRNGVRCKVAQQDFFNFDWREFFAELQGEILVLGNPPWVTNAALGAIESDNLPEKTNFQNHAGFAAKTGKANFDISEWILIKLLEALDDKSGCVAMLCKTATARKVLRHAWYNHFNISRASLHLINAAEHFGVSVDACLLIVHTGVTELSRTATVYSDFAFSNKLTTFGLIGKALVAEVDEYNRLKDLDGFSYYTWRSGVKHDASSVMEFKAEGTELINGLGERVELEASHIYPLLKSSDLANARLTPRRQVLITQRRPGDDTKAISVKSPKTWAYLLRHANILDGRRSIIYRKRARFSIFGVGDYTFAPWKVAISGLYKNCRFEVVGKHRNKAIILDDTCYFIPCRSEEEASFVCNLLNSDITKRFLHTLIFFDAKRPITIDVLNRVDLNKVAEKLGLESEAHKYFRDAGLIEKQQSLLVFEKAPKYQAKSSSKKRISHRL